MSNNTEYKVMARTMRPQLFEDVVGQDKTKVTLKNAFKLGRLGHAYLFCGSHGIGKTTLARIFAKVLNCDTTQDGEPCGNCSSCKEIAAACSLDVIEIDGASNRGIDDIRQINESVGFAVKANKYKIYILDEVHMLTKEAFNALLKTLEDPPPRVKFLFATTEPHKIPTTILSRCQCFYLEPITTEQIAQHLTKCAQMSNIPFEKEAAYLLAKRANGSLRDALVLADQLISYCNEDVKLDKAIHFLGLLPKSELFEFDVKASRGELEAAFNLAKDILSSGKSLANFLDMLCEHYRQILYIKIYKGNPSSLQVPQADWPSYEQSANCYSYEQCLHIIDLILETQNKIKNALSKQIALENLLIQIVRSHARVSIKSLIDQLDTLKSNLNTTPLKQEIYKNTTPIEKPPSPKVPPKEPESKKEPVSEPLKVPLAESISKKELTIEPQKVAASPTNSDAEKQNICYNTVMQFAAVELEGSLKKEGN